MEYATLLNVVLNGATALLVAYSARALKHIRTELEREREVMRSELETIRNGGRNF